MSKSSHVSARWQLNLYKDINWKEEIQTFLLGGKQIKVTQQQEELTLAWFLLGHNSQILSACRLSFSSDCQSLENTTLLIGSQSLVNIVVLLLIQNIGVVMLSLTLRLPLSHRVPLKPGAQLQLNTFTRSVQVPLFSQG